MASRAFAVDENIDRTFNLNLTYVLLGFRSGCIIIYSFTCGIKNQKKKKKREHGIQIVLQVPHPYEPDSFPEYDCHISYAFLPLVVGNFLRPEVPHHKIWI